MCKKNNKEHLFNPKNWGLTEKFTSELEKGFYKVCNRFRKCFKTKTSDESKYAKHYLRGLLIMDKNKNIANISRKVISPFDDGQRLQHFISDSPWDWKNVFHKIISEIISTSELHDGILTLDDSGEKKSGNHSIGVSRQYIGSDGKVENGQVGVCVGYYKSGYWSLVGAELYIPKNWFDKYSKNELWKNWYVPQDRIFKTKSQIGFELIKDALCRKLPFNTVLCDS